MIVCKVFELYLWKSGLQTYAAIAQNQGFIRTRTPAVEDLAAVRDQWKGHAALLPGPEKRRSCFAASLSDRISCKFCLRGPRWTESPSKYLLCMFWETKSDFEAQRRWQGRSDTQPKRVGGLPSRWWGWWCEGCCKPWIRLRTLQSPIWPTCRSTGAWRTRGFYWFEAFKPVRQENQACTPHPPGRERRWLWQDWEQVGGRFGKGTIWTTVSYEAQGRYLLRLQSLLKRQKCERKCELWTFEAWRSVQPTQSRRK